MARNLETSYIGEELDLFALATHWKAYVKAELGEYLVGNVLEVGAGIGGTTAALNDGRAKCWVCLEPDSKQAQRLRRLVLQRCDPGVTLFVAGSLTTFIEKPYFDCVLYIDVLEHVADDRRQIDMAAKLVRPGGYIVILSPAHQWLFSNFDKAIGHLRRYNKRALRALRPPGWHEQKLMYLDSVGVALSLGNAIVLRQKLPTQSQIMIWDRLCVPISRILDRALCGNFGRSVLAVWRKHFPT